MPRPEMQICSPCRIHATGGPAMKSRRLKLFCRAALGAAIFVLWGVFSSAALAQNPVPFVNQPLVPDATAPGGPPFNLTVNGTGFVSGAVVHWNGSALATQFISASQLKATVSAADIATAGTASVTVVNPSPGGGTSNVAFFTVRVHTYSVALALASSPAGSGPVAVGDFNGDGKLDLALGGAGRFGGLLLIQLGDGKGNFTLASSVPTGPYLTSVAVGDFNGDGKLDLAVGGANEAYTGVVFILL